MARIKIIVKDTRENTATLQIESDPPFPGPAAKDQTMTPAQRMALVMGAAGMKYARGEIDEDLQPTTQPIIAPAEKQQQ